MTSERTERRLIEWTGERCVPWTDDLQVVYEHLHRYHFAAELRPEGEVLDVGSGEGYGSAILARSAKTVVGVDVDPASIEHSRLNHSQENLRFVQASALELEGQFPDCSFDLVVCFELIEHVHEQQQVVATMARVLREDGLLLISTPDRDPYNEARGEANPYHFPSWTGRSSRTCSASTSPTSPYGGRAPPPVRTSASGPRARNGGDLGR